MQLDRTYIAIRPRSLFEIFDLALHVIRDHFRRLFVLWLIGATPLALLNWMLIGWMADVRFANDDYLVAYFFLQALLIINQTQVASVFITAYLGAAMFEDQTLARQAIRKVFSTNPYLFWSHGVLRGVFPLILVVSLIGEALAPEDLVLSCLGATAVAGIGLMVRVWRPFVNEILVLEKTPIKKRRGTAIRFAARSAHLHDSRNGGLVGRFCLVSLVAVPLTMMVWGCLNLVNSTLNVFSGSELDPAVVFFPLAAWVVSGFVAVIRFLAYIDTRIRQEGWDVELLIRAQASRLSEVGVGR
jgi:hypothetical protein